MREVDNKTSALQPFPLAGSNELINDDLSAVGEITELGFPDCQRVGADEGVTQLEAKASEFGQRRIADNELGLGRAEVVERDILLLVVLVMDDSVTLREGTTLDILPRDTNMDLLKSERSKSEGLSGSPVDTLALQIEAASATAS
jgi:hypothetical protein